MYIGFKYLWVCLEPSRVKHLKVTQNMSKLLANIRQKRKKISTEEHASLFCPSLCNKGKKVLNTDSRKFSV
jgi:hypothetical protein